MAERYVNKGPVMRIPGQDKGYNATFNTTQGGMGGRKDTPYEFNTATGKTQTPDEFNPEDFGGPPEASRFEMNQGIDPSRFDVSDKEQVLAFQKQAGLEEDGMFGPNTQKAWEEYVNSRRAREGRSQYTENAQGQAYGGGQDTSLMGLVTQGEGGQLAPDNARVQENIQRNNQAGMYQDDVSQQGSWGRLGDSLKDTASYWGDKFFGLGDK
tara:strand:+ start:689 stop:1321 length:633 start_codon:yes stop_codon:yes gene_type:complete